MSLMCVNRLLIVSVFIVFPDLQLLTCLPSPSPGIDLVLSPADGNTVLKDSHSDVKAFNQLVNQLNETIARVIRSYNEAGSNEPNLFAFDDDSFNFPNLTSSQKPQQQGNEFLQEAVLAVMLQQLKGFFPGINIDRLALMAKVFANFWPAIRNFMRDNPDFFQNIYKRITGNNTVPADVSLLNITTTFAPEILF